MSTSTSWSDVVTKIKNVSNRGALNWSGSNTTYTVSAGYYTGGTLDSRTSYNNGYNSGRTQGRNDVKNSPNSYSLYTKSQYDSNWSNGYNNGRSNIKVTSGATNTSFWEDATWNGSTKSRVCVNISPGGNPLLVFAYRTDHNDVAAESSNFGFVNTGGRNYVVSSRHQFNSSGIHLPTTDGSTGKTWNWYCAVY